MQPYKRVRTKESPSVDEHRVIMERHIGRKLSRFEFVHHVNGNKRDNRIENLKLVNPKEHAIEHDQWKHPEKKICQFCGSEFTPHPTKRERAKTCSRECRYSLTSMTNRRPDAPRSMYRAGAYPSEVSMQRRSRKSS